MARNGRLDEGGGAEISLRMLAVVLLMTSPLCSILNSASPCPAAWTDSRMQDRVGGISSRIADRLENEPRREKAKAGVRGRARRAMSVRKHQTACHVVKPS
jgi:hypothetical protein